MTIFFPNEKVNVLLSLTPAMSLLT